MNGRISPTGLTASFEDVPQRKIRSSFEEESKTMNLSCIICPVVWKEIEMTEDEKLEFVAARILKEHRAAFEELAK